MERKASSHNGHRAGAEAPPDIDHLEDDIDRIRGNLGGLLNELDRRRHDAFDVRRQLRRHGVAVGLGLLAVAGIVTAGILLHRERGRRARSLPARARALRRAVRRVAAEPDRVAEAYPRVGKKILAAGGTAVASVVGRRIAERIVRRR